MIKIVCNNYCGRTVQVDGTICSQCQRELETKLRISDANIFKINYNYKTDNYTLLNKDTNTSIDLSNDQLNGLYKEIYEAFEERDDMRGYHP